MAMNVILASMTYKACVYNTLYHLLCLQGQSNKADAEKDVKQDPSSINKNVPRNQQSDPVHNSKYAGIPPTSSSAESVTAGKPATINSRRQGTRGEVRFIFLAYAKVFCICACRPCIKHH